MGLLGERQKNFLSSVCRVGFCATFVLGYEQRFQNGFLIFLQKVFQPNKLLNLHEHWVEAIKARAEKQRPEKQPFKIRAIKQLLTNKK
jgi:hypothetical protein